MREKTHKKHKQVTRAHTGKKNLELGTLINEHD
jgi:hypothetical protein